MQLASDFEDFITWGLLVLYQVCLRCLGSHIEVNSSCLFLPSGRERLKMLSLSLSIYINYEVHD